MTRCCAVLTLFAIVIGAMGNQVQPAKALPERAAAREIQVGRAAQAVGDAAEKTANKNPVAESDQADENGTEKKEPDNGSPPESNEAAAAAEPAETHSDTDEKDASAEDEKTPEKPKSFQVESKPLTVEVKLAGVFVADQMEEVKLRPEVWATFKVLAAVEHGTAVKKNDVLVRFDPEDLEKELAEQSITQRLNEVAFLRAEEEFPRKNQLAEIAFQAAQRRHEQLREDFEYYQNTDRPFSITIAHFLYKDAKEDLASQHEELEQLKKMYEADELTEDTEQIVLRRQEFQVERAELVMQLETADRDRALNVNIPRRDEQYRVAMEESDLSFQQAKMANATGRTRRAFEMEQLRENRARSIERHANLLSDKGLMEIRAPSDGIAYYGRCLDGKWAEVSTMKAKLKPDGSVTAKSVLMTIVNQRPLHVETTCEENDLPSLADGQSATISPAADDEVGFSGTVTKLDTVPGKNNKFNVQLDFDNSNIPDWLVAGMTCKTKITTYHNEKALQIPAALVQADEDDEKVKYVMLIDPEAGEPVKRKVKLGHKQGKMVEVLKGLAEGDEIVKEEKKDPTDSE
ncbi:MAG: HlyD family efflux transporter periplasmic adaptor subunit [Pirellulales bacterium]|nr:HlyD family efflux transporter periplasmic adaptor subunit [Pirellulales bacterium]